MDSSIPVETVVALEFPSSPPSPPRSPIPCSRLSITTTANESVSFAAVPTPRSASFPHKSPTFSKPPPAIPPQWLWRCHVCGLAYPLGTTRRCLNDGHYFCAGLTISKKTGKRKAHSPCGSTFDYIGWQQYGDWRRCELKFQARAVEKARELNSQNQSIATYLTGLVGIRRSGKSNHQDEDLDTDESDDEAKGSDIVSHGITKPSDQRHCEHNCNYPSECRWGQKMSPTKDKKKRRIRKKSMSAPQSPEEITLSIDRQLLEDTKDADVASANNQQEHSFKNNDSRKPLTEFGLPKSTIRRNQSFSLPFTSYSWLTEPQSLLINPPSPPSSEVIDLGEISHDNKKQIWPLASLNHTLLEESIEDYDDFKERIKLSNQSENALHRTTSRHRLLTPETTPEPVERKDLGFADSGEHEVGFETDSSSEGGIIRASSSSSEKLYPLSDWKWSFGTLASIWDKSLMTEQL